jgi:hypothetical protein
MNNKYAGAKQTQNCNNCFNHLTHPNYSTAKKPLIIGLCFTTASSGRKNGFAAPGKRKGRRQYAQRPTGP